MTFTSFNKSLKSCLYVLLLLEISGYIFTSMSSVVYFDTTQKNVRTYLLHCLKQPSGNDTKAILTALLVVPSIWYSHGVRWWIQVSHIFTSFISSLSFQWAQKTTLNCSPLLHFALTSCEVGESSYYSKYLEASYVIFPVFFPDFFFTQRVPVFPLGSDCGSSADYCFEYRKSQVHFLSSPTKRV